VPCPKQPVSPLVYNRSSNEASLGRRPVNHLLPSVGGGTVQAVKSEPTEFPEEPNCWQAPLCTQRLES
jgi:hypothetical protein